MKSRSKNIAIAVGALAVIVAVIWVDIATGVWSELVILAGLASGLVTFLLTVLVLDKILARATERKWAPVNRLALTEFLHAIADEEHSEISRGVIVPRTLALLNSSVAASENGVAGADFVAYAHGLREQVVDERTRLTEALSRWAEFLASSGDNEQILIHVAEIATQLDRVRDAAVEAELQKGSPSALAGLDDEVSRCNDSMRGLEAELQARLAVR